MIGKVLDDTYEIVRLLGKGGMGAVYEAKRDGKPNCAVKVIDGEAVSEDEVLVTRFAREVQAVQKVRSPHIVEILAAGHTQDSGHPYMAMELLRGDNTLQLLERLGPLPPKLAVRVGIQTCRGLAVAHEAGVVHRDIKPANLFLAEGASGELSVKLLDFGVAKLKMDQASESANESLTRTGSMLGAPMYMSPEQARGLKTIDQRADIWSLGIVLYQLLSGRVPCQDIDGLGELIITICLEPPAAVVEVAPWVGGKLSEVVAGALQLSSDARYQSAHEMAEALEGCLEEADTKIIQSMVVPADKTASGADHVWVRAGGGADGDAATVMLDSPPVFADDGGTVELPPEALQLPPEALELPSPAGQQDDRSSDRPPQAEPEERRVGDGSSSTPPKARQAALEAAQLDSDDEASGPSWWVMALVGVVLGVAVVYAYARYVASPPAPAPASSASAAPSK